MIIIFTIVSTEEYIYIFLLVEKLKILVNNPAILTYLAAGIRPLIGPDLMFMCMCVCVELPLYLKTMSNRGLDVSSGGILSRLFMEGNCVLTDCGLRLSPS